MFRLAASSTPSTLTQTVIRLGAVAVACSALTWSLSGCGGGSRAKEYAPSSVVSFGDENSLIETYTSATNHFKDSAGASTTLKGLTYTVNSLLQDAPLYCVDSVSNPAACVTASAYTDVGNDFVASVSTFAHVFDGTKPNTVTLIERGTATKGGTPATPLQRSTVLGYNCAESVLWNQVVAHSFGKGFGDACAIDNDGAKSYAAYGATIANLQAQVAAHRAELGEGVLVTIMVGQHDILELYRDTLSHPQNEAANRQELSNRVANLANIVKDVLSTGAKVVLAYPPDLSKSPLASKNGANANLLALFVDDRFLGGNSLKIGFIPTLIRSLGSGVTTDGRHFAVVETNNLTNLQSAGYVYGPNRLCDENSTYLEPDGSVTAESDPGKLVKYCTRSNFVTNGSTSTYMWADDIHFAPLGHALIGSQAASRAYNQF
ncbi:SGNH/GDSL hydrolase family protein [Aquabacterium sp.]|uniref:SGNH/GDSL hydrolase family protein n=1 Tax=Aquabacterium sp. TaxID=1872578 RepID=UPI0025C39589|nr:SGNH/GDSL hydrolase family protein [Aquabacterium sp.]